MQKYKGNQITIRIFLCHTLLGLSAVTSGTVNLHTRFGPCIHTLNNQFNTNKTSFIKKPSFTFHKMMTFVHSSEIYAHVFIQISLEITLLS